MRLRLHRGLSVMVIVTIATCTGALAASPRGAPVTAGATATATATRTMLSHPQNIDSSIRTPDGRTRTYRLHVPANLPAGPVPLLVALHGGTGWGTQFEQNSGFDALAEQHGFLVVYPDGVGAGLAEKTMRTWNAGICCGPAVRKGVDDVGFIRLLIDQVERGHQIDHTRVFAAGHSNGGFLAYRLACELSDRIVAVGVQSAGLGIPSCHPSRPVSLLHIHGTADQNVPIAGGYGPASIAQVNFPSVAWSVRTVAAAMHCTAGPSVVTDPSNRDITRTTWTDPRGAVAVRLVTVAGASHTWMGHTPSSPRAAAPYMRLDSSVEIVRFLLAHPRVSG